MKKHEEQQGSTAHKTEPGATQAGEPSGDEPMPMGMLGGAPAERKKDPDQKSTHVAPATVETTLPDGSPTYADPGTRPAKVATKRGTEGKAGRYEVVSRISTARYDRDGNRAGSSVHEPGDVVELDADEAGSFGDAIKPVQ
jgi:hypothetical protein